MLADFPLQFRRLEHPSLSMEIFHNLVIVIVIVIVVEGLTLVTERAKVFRKVP